MILTVLKLITGMSIIMGFATVYSLLTHEEKQPDWYLKIGGERWKIIKSHGF